MSMNGANLIDEPGPACARIPLQSGQLLLVCGKDTREAWTAATLALFVADGKLDLPLLPGVGGAYVLTEERLVAMLKLSFGDKPAVVAQAVQALRRLDPRRDDVILGTMLRVPDLARLFAAVRLELTGEAA